MAIDKRIRTQEFRESLGGARGRLHWIADDRALPPLIGMFPRVSLELASDVCPFNFYKLGEA